MAATAFKSSLFPFIMCWRALLPSAAMHSSPAQHCPLIPLTFFSNKNPKFLSQAKKIFHPLSYSLTSTHLILSLCYIQPEFFSLQFIKRLSSAGHFPSWFYLSKNITLLASRYQRWNFLPSISAHTSFSHKASFFFPDSDSLFPILLNHLCFSYLLFHWWLVYVLSASPTQMTRVMRMVES